MKTELRNKLTKLAEKGLTMKEAQNIAGVSYDLILYYKKTLNLEFKKELSTKEKIRGLLNEGKTRQEIQKNLGINRSLLHFHIKQLV